MIPVLASASPARRRLLEQAGVPVRVDPAQIDERRLEEPLLGMGIAPADLAGRLAEAKAQDVAARHPGRLVVGADQVLEIDGRRLVKPADRGEARRQLLTLRGRAHELHSAAVLARDGAVLWSGRDTARLAMRAFSEAFLEDYLDRSGERVLGAVGAYELEGLGVQLFERVEGDYFTVLGLPLLPLLAALRDQGVLRS